MSCVGSRVVTVARLVAVVGLLVLTASACGAVEITDVSAERVGPVRAGVTGPGPERALRLLDTLQVKGRAPMTGYDRDAFGSAWADVDRNGCDTRNDILRRDLVETDIEEGTEGCVVLSGDLAPDPYTGGRVHFEYGGSSEVDIDHVVALGDAWQKGAFRWDENQRLAFANDPLNLLAVDAPANRQKGDADTATWLPSHGGFRCAYVSRQVVVKARYDLWVTAAERDAMRRVLSSCQ